MKKSIIVFFAITLIVSFHCRKQDSEQIITVNTAVGDIRLITAEGEAVPKAGDSVAQGDTVITGKASMIDLVYSNKGLIRISENSNVKIETLLTDRNSDTTKLAMDRGKLFVTISRLKKESSFEVKSSTSVAAVRGTSLRVTADEHGSRVDVLKGKVNVVPVNKGNAMPESAKVVEENQTVSLDTKLVTGIAEKKQEIQVTIIPKEEVKVIQEEIKNMQPAANMSAEVIQETRDIITPPAINEAAGSEKPGKAQADRVRLEREKAEKAERDRIARENAEKSKTDQDAVTQPQRKEQKSIPLAPNL